MRPIKPANNRGSILLRFQVDGVRYSFNPIRGGQWSDAIDRGKAAAIAAQITLDIQLGQFDPSLERYRLRPGECSPPTAPSRQTANKRLLAVWDSWVESLDLAPQTKADHYEMVRRMIVKSGTVKTADATWLKPYREALAPATFNKRLGYLRSCLTWAIRAGLYAGPNPYVEVKPLKGQARGDKVQPFSQSEIHAILKALERLHPYYVPFVKFLFLTGVRTGEAIALQWQHVSFDFENIKVCESLSVNRSGNGYQRIRKQTKTGESRYLPINPPLMELLLMQSDYDPEPSDLVFPSPKGEPIDPGRFRRFVWKPTLEAAGVPYRNPYQTRHTFLTYAVMDPSIGVLGAAKLAGHRDSRMVTKHYARFIGQPDLPDLDI